MMFKTLNLFATKGGGVVSYNYSKLLGRITEKIGTQGKFANAIELSERTVSLKLNGRVGWKQDEIVRACEVLGIDTKDIADYFFTL